ncbi:MAG: sigma-70 family RNA polymerase sigma factor [Planctomycetes bacterium]|nr:sigma-70 family RNA polymerase sigma factor [Planctomycetota bacterium]
MPQRAPREVETEVLLARYRRKPSPRLRDEVVERHRDEVEAIARSLAARLPARVDVDDLVHAGMWGLLQSIEKFRADRGAPFRPFMRPRVRGAMLDELRNMDFLPRLYRRRQRDRTAAVDRLRARLQRDPNDAELAEELGVSECRLRRSYAPPGADLRARGVGGASANGDADWLESVIDDDVDSPIDCVERQDLIERIEACLTPIEWTVLRMHYLEGMSGKEVAARLRLSASRICQIHLRVLSRLKARLGGTPV